MLSKELIERMKNDKELEELRKRVFEITGNRKDITFILGKYSYEDWKANMKRIIKEYESADQ